MISNLSAQHISLSLPITENSSCTMAPNIAKTVVFRTVCLYVNGELSNTSNPALEHIDRCFEDIVCKYKIHSDDENFLFREKFMQTLPTLPRDNPIAPGDCCVLQFQLYKCDQSFKLSQHIGVRESKQTFSELLLSLGWNQLSVRSNASFPGTIQMLPQCIKWQAI